MGKEERRASARIQAAEGGRSKKHKKQTEPIAVDSNGESPQPRRQVIQPKERAIVKTEMVKRKRPVEEMTKLGKGKDKKKVEEDQGTNSEDTGKDEIGHTGSSGDPNDDEEGCLTPNESLSESESPTTKKKMLGFMP